jgi:hypothetical protein
MVKVQNLPSAKQLIINKKKSKNTKRIEQENFYRNGQSVGHGFEMKPMEWYVPLFVIYKAGLEPTPYW